METIRVLGAASGLAANERGSEHGPDVVRRSPQLQQLRLPLVWEEDIALHVNSNTLTLADKLPLVANWCEKIADKTQSFVTAGQRFAVIGGDHSCAMGTWSGVQQGLTTNEALGLLWIDAHLDSHTPETTESGNIHGMPVAALLGYGDASLTSLGRTRPVLTPDRVCLIGIRSYEQAELALIERLGVKVYYMKDVLALGMETVLREAHALLQRHASHIGLSIDLDGLDPSDSPGVSTPEPNGIRVADLYPALKALFQDPHFVGIEIAEFNPEHDLDRRSESIICNILKGLCYDRHNSNKH